MPAAAHARASVAVLEPLVAYIYFVPEAAEEYGALGVDAAQGYFLSRSAAMGRATPQTVASAFFNFNPRLVGKLLRWELTDPEQMLAARRRAVERSGSRLLANDDGSLPDTTRAVELMREGLEAARTEGRILFAAHSRLPWPDDPIGALWHGANLLREYRGDGHITVLLSHSIDAVEALVLHAAFMKADPTYLFATRAWGEEAYADARARLVARGFLDEDGTLSDAGGKFREMIELETDRLASPPFAALGPERSEELIELARPLAQRVIDHKPIPPNVRATAQGPVRA